METDAAPPAAAAAAEPAPAAAPAAPAEDPASPKAVRRSRLASILSGETPILLSLDFLFRKNAADLLVLKNIKARPRFSPSPEPAPFTTPPPFSSHALTVYVSARPSAQSAVDNRQVTLHGSMVLSNALMHAGTTVDLFLRENLDWWVLAE